MEESIKNINKTQEHKFNVVVAMEVGLNSAALFSRISHWIIDNEANGKNKREGKYWTYDSRKAIIERMPYFTLDTLKRATQKLVDHKFLEVRLDLNRNSWDRTAWYTIGERGFDPKVLGTSPSGRNHTTLNGNVTNDINTYKDTLIDQESSSKDKLGDESPLANNISNSSIGNKRVIPIKDYNKFRSWVKAWNGKKETTNHILKEQDKNQSKVIFNAYTYLTEAFIGLDNFYDKYNAELDPVWLTRNKITKETVLESLKTLELKDLLSSHSNWLKNNAVGAKEDFMIPTKKLDEFFIFERSRDDTGSVKRSWLLYWLCKPLKMEQKKAEQVIPPLERKYPDKFTQYYKSVGEVFNVNINKLEKTPVTLNNQVILLSEAIIEEIKEKNRYLAKKAKLNISTLTEDIQEFLKSQDYISQFNPTQFMPTRKSWNNMIDFLAGKTDECYKKTFDVLYHDVISSDF